MATAHIVAMKVDQGLNGLLHRRHLQKGHLAILKELEGLHCASRVGEEKSQVLFIHLLRDVGEMESG